MHIIWGKWVGKMSHLKDRWGFFERDYLFHGESMYSKK